MAEFLGKNLISTLLGSPRVTAGVSTGGSRAVGGDFETAGYASIPYERAPQVLDTVPTKGLIAGYSTPTYVWTF